MVVDTDHFERINRVYSQAAGDAVLRHLTAGLRSTVRAIDEVARIDGEQFAMLMIDTTHVYTCAVALCLCPHNDAYVAVVDGTTIHYTVNVGVTSMDDTVASAEDLLKRAYTAMYFVKGQRRNRGERWRAKPVTSAQASAIPTL